METFQILNQFIYRLHLLFITYIWGPDKCKDFIEDWLDATSRSKRQSTFDGLVLEDISCVDLSNNAKGNPEATDVGIIFSRFYFQLQ